MKRNIVDLLEQMEENCRVFNKMSTALRRFWLTVGTVGLRFKHLILVDTMLIYRRPAIQMVDEVKHF